MYKIPKYLYIIFQSLTDAEKLFFGKRYFEEDLLSIFEKKLRDIKNKNKQSSEISNSISGILEAISRKDEIKSEEVDKKELEEKKGRYPVNMYLSAEDSTMELNADDEFMLEEFIKVYLVQRGSIFKIVSKDNPDAEKYVKPFYIKIKIIGNLSFHMCLN